MMLLGLTGYPRKNFEELEDEMDKNMMKVEASTRKFLHAVSYPGKPNLLVCVELGQSSAHYAEEGEKLREVANISVSTQPLFDEVSLQEKLEETEGENTGRIMKIVAPDDPYYEQMTMKL